MPVPAIFTGLARVTGRGSDISNYMGLVPYKE